MSDFNVPGSRPKKSTTKFRRSTVQGDPPERHDAPRAGRWGHGRDRRRAGHQFYASYIMAYSIVSLLSLVVVVVVVVVVVCVLSLFLLIIIIIIMCIYIYIYMYNPPLLRTSPRSGRSPGTSSGSPTTSPGSSTYINYITISSICSTTVINNTIVPSL